MGRSTKDDPVIFPPGYADNQALLQAAKDLLLELHNEGVAHWQGPRVVLARVVANIERGKS